MAYSELIKNFDRIRDYMREFYVYGFKSREDYDKKSARSYDDERRRIESWLGDNMSFRQTADGKNVFISIDSHSIPSNPLYNAFKAKSFTAGDITFHFYIMDLLSDGKWYSIQEIVDSFSDKYYSSFDDLDELDTSTVRKKLKEYVSIGLLKQEKRGRELVFARDDAGIPLEAWKDAVAFFSEVAPVGVVGSYILDKYDTIPNYLTFKHHYILHALDSEIIAALLEAIYDRRVVEVSIRRRRGVGKDNTYTVLPVKIYESTQLGRQYLLGYHYSFKRFIFFRIDSIKAVKPGSVEHNFEKYLGYYENFRKNLWGVSTGVSFSLDHIEMIIHYEDNEGYIPQRLEREKRCGTIEYIDEHTAKFVADVYDATEMLPWLRTFIGRVEKLECSNKYVESTFYSDITRTLNLYLGGNDNAV